MKKTFKNIITLGMVASFIATPFAAFAKDGADDNDNDGDRSMGMMRGNPATFCDMVKDKSVDDFRHMGDREDMMQDKWNTRDNIIAGIRAKFDTKRDDNESERQEKFDALIANWEANAKTDAEKSAIADFKVQLHSVIEDHNGAVASIVADTRDDKDVLRADARAKIDAAVVELQEKISAALSKAQTDCANGVSSATVRTNFAADVKAAMDAFKTTRTTIHTETKADATVIHDERKTDMTEARGSFRGFFQSLRDRFRSLFGMHAKVSGETGTE